MITAKVAEALGRVNHALPEDVRKIFQANLKRARGREKKLWRLLMDNERLAQKEKLPLCQDTGLVIAFVRLGQKVLVEGGTLEEAIDAGVSQSYRKNYFRKSMVAHPLKRKNTRDNAPAAVHLETAPGNEVEITLLIKGAGAENQSRLLMLSPSAGLPGIKKFVLDTVKTGGPSACPPLVVGVGLGGTFDTVGRLAKKALLRKVGQPSADKEISRLEKELLADINRLKIGLFDLKCGPTALAVHLETAPCHMASLPVAVNLQCHAIREIRIVI
jgi:fumarate hydratase subunit alpha